MRKLVLFALVVIGLTVVAFADNPHTPRAPIVVAEQSLKNQLSIIPSTVLFTPTAEGNFRISVYLDWSPSAVSTSGGNVPISWTDDFQSPMPSSVVFGPLFTNTGFAQNVTVIHDLANQPISFSVGAAGSGITQPYNLYIAVEQL